MTRPPAYRARAPPALPAGAPPRNGPLGRMHTDPNGRSIMRLFNSRKRKVLTTFAVCFVTGIVSLALAAWLTDSNGTGRGQTGTIQKPLAASLRLRFAIFSRF